MRNNQSGGKGGKGYYIALVLCAAAIGIISYVTRTDHKSEPEQISLMEQSPKNEVSSETEAVEALATQPRETKPIGRKPVIKGTAPEETQPQRLKTGTPLEGTPTAFYAMDNLSYNETTRDWRTHNGVDYPGSEGAPVCAAADGTVVTVKEDDLMGVTVTLRHLGGYETTYSGLQAEPKVREGEKVVLGQSIGAVGTTALAESALGPHIHFSVSYQDMPMNPQDFLALG